MKEGFLMLGFVHNFLKVTPRLEAKYYRPGRQVFKQMQVDHLGINQNMKGVI